MLFRWLVERMVSVETKHMQKGLKQYGMTLAAGMHRDLFARATVVIRAMPASGSIALIPFVS